MNILQRRIFWNGGGAAANDGTNAANNANSGGAAGTGTGANAGPDANAGTANAGNAGGTGTGSAGANAAAGTPTIEQLQAQLTEAQGKLTAYDTAAETRRQAELTATQRAEEAATKAQNALVAAEVKLAAKNAGAADVDIVKLLIDPKAIVRNADGEATNLDALVTAILAAKPYLKANDGTVQPGVPDVRATNGGNGGSSAKGQSFTTSQVADPQFYAANQQAIHLAVKEGRILEG